MNKTLARIGVTITNVPVLPVGVGYKHIATELQISKSTDFENKNNLILNPNDEEGRNISLAPDLLKPYTDFEIDTDQILYMRYRFLFNKVNDPSMDRNTWEASNWSPIVSTSSRMRAFFLDDIVITTPVVRLDEKPGDSIDASNITITAEGFAIIKGAGQHASTTWVVTDQDNRVVFSRPLDVNNKTSITLPYSLFNTDKLFIIKAKFHGDIGGESNFGEFLYNPHVSKLKNYELVPILPFSEGQSLYFRFIPHRANITGIGIVIKENRYDTEVEVFRSENIRPATSVQVPSTKLVVGKQYVVYSFIKYRETSGDYTSGLMKVTEFTFNKTILYPEVPNCNYPGEYGDMGKVNYGNAVINSAEFKNGMIPLASNSVKTFELYGRYGMTMKKTGLTFQLPVIAGDEADDGTLLPYLNVIPMYNDMFAVNYCIYTSTQYKRSVWAFYKIDLANNRIKPIQEDNWFKIVPEELYSTAISSSAVCTKDNSIYYIPAAYTNGTDINTFLDLPLRCVSLSKLGDTYNIQVETKIPSIKAGIKHHMTLCPYNASTDSEEKLLALGGTTAETRNETTAGAGEILGTPYYTLSNLDIMVYNLTENQFTTIGKLPDGTGRVTPFPTDRYNLAAFRRADGKIVIFNNSNAGPSKYNSSTYLMDLSKVSSSNNQNAIVENNETNIDFPFTSTIRMRNGDFLRISYTPTEYNRILLYPYVPLLKYTDAEVAVNKHLVVRPGEFITIINPYLYETIEIQGTTPEDTGKLKWVDKSKVRVLDFRDKIYTRDTTVTPEEDANRPKEHLYILDGVNYTVSKKQ